MKGIVLNKVSGIQNNKTIKLMSIDLNLLLHASVNLNVYIYDSHNILDAVPI
jgi:hypothetical protein